MRVSIAQLQAAGMTSDQIVALLKEREAARREQNRKSQIKQRARQHEGDLRSVRADIADASIEEKKVRKRRKIKIGMPADWMPTEADRAYARTKNWSDQRIDSEARRFRNYYRANGKTMLDWSPKWENWIDSEFQNGGQQHGRRQGSLLDGFDRLGAALCKAGASDDYVPGSEGPRPLQLDREMRSTGLRLIPKG